MKKTALSSSRKAKSGNGTFNPAHTSDFKLAQNALQRADSLLTLLNHDQPVVMRRDLVGHRQKYIDTNWLIIHFGSSDRKNRAQAPSSVALHREARHPLLPVLPNLIVAICCIEMSMAMLAVPRHEELLEDV